MAQQIDPEKVEEIIRETAKKCILPYHQKLQSHHIDTKTGPNDLVTIADKESEAYLDKKLTALVPGSVLIGEESISDGTKDIGVLKDKSKIIWVVDPVDGTYNFVHGKKEFCVMVACVVDGETQFGWIYDIPGDRMLRAVKGQGTTINGVKQSVAASVDTKDASGHAGMKYFSKEMKPFISALGKDVKELYTLSCAGHEYMRLASGQSDFAIYSKIRQWDHLAGVLAVEESGGIVRKWDGTKYEPQDAFGGIVVASNETLLGRVQSKAIKPIVKEYKKKL